MYHESAVFSNEGRIADNQRISPFWEVVFYRVHPASLPDSFFQEQTLGGRRQRIMATPDPQYEICYAE